VGAVLTPAVSGAFLLCFDRRIGLAAPVVLLAMVVGRRITERTEADHHAATADAGSRLGESPDRY
jgi:ATP-binding cassette subfamily B protein